MNDYILALVVLIVISIIYTISCCIRRSDPQSEEKFDLPASLEQARYGLNPMVTPQGMKVPCTRGPCLAGPAFRAQDTECDRIGGTSVGRSQARFKEVWNQAGIDIRGTPRAWLPCNMQVVPATNAKYSFGSRAQCPQHPVIIRTRGSTCRMMEGTPVGFPADNEISDCQVGLCPIKDAKWRLSPVNSPSIGTIAVGEESPAKCHLMGGSYVRRGRCDLAII